MKKTALSILITLCSLHSFAQDCTVKEDKLFELINNFSSAYLFNTYGLIGSIADGHTHNAYEDNTVKDLLNAQKKLVTDLSGVVEKKLAEDSLITQSRKDYLKAFTEVLKEFNEQIDLYLKYMQNDSRKNMDAYISFRKKLWKDINQLYGIKD
jgi:hypothetical protein